MPFILPLFRGTVQTVLLLPEMVSCESLPLMLSGSLTPEPMEAAAMLLMSLLSAILEVLLLIIGSFANAGSAMASASMPNKWREVMCMVMTFF